MSKEFVLFVLDGYNKCKLPLVKHTISDTDAPVHVDLGLEEANYDFKVGVRNDLLTDLNEINNFEVFIETDKGVFSYPYSIYDGGEFHLTTGHKEQIDMKIKWPKIKTDCEKIKIKGGFFAYDDKILCFFHDGPIMTQKDDFNLSYTLTANEIKE